MHDGFEEANDAWQAEGWVRTDNRLPQQTWLQVVQETPDGIAYVTRSLMTESGEILVDLQPDAWAAHIAISPIVPRSSLNTDYSLEVRLFDVEGAPMTTAIECRVTTTHGLNHRAVPNGKKIGLLPQGATVTALDRRQGWYRVAYDGNYRLDQRRLYEISGRLRISFAPDNWPPSADFAAAKTMLENERALRMRPIPRAGKDSFASPMQNQYNSE